MRLPDFKVEQWMTQYEGQARYNLTDTCVQAVPFHQLADVHEMKDIVLDYGCITGDEETKTLIAQLYTKGSIQQITTAHGCLEANELVMMTLLEKGDHVITVVPGYQQFVDIPKSIGCDVTLVQTEEANQWKPDMRTLCSLIRQETKMVILNNPCNPTGALLEEEDLKELIALCETKGVYLFCDEVYRDPRIQPSVSDLCSMGISTGSLSKSFGLAGLRYGWVKGPEHVIDQINIRRDYAMVSTGPVADFLARKALEQKEELLQRGQDLIAQNKKTLEQWCQNNPLFHVCLPQAGTVCFLGYDFEYPSTQLALDLMQEGIFFVPGDCFDTPGYLRMGLGQDAQQTKVGLERLSQWVQAHIG